MNLSISTLFFRARPWMAKPLSYSLSIILLLSVVTLLLLMTGCANQQVVEHIPAPNFNGPVVLAPANPPPPVAQVPTPTKSSAGKPPAKQFAGIPADWIPAAQPRAWKWIVIHHSATPSGSAAVFDAMHKAKGWDELGYDFVIGNGTQSGNGEVEVGPRWPKQKWGAHAKTPNNEYNDRGIGICLVGNFDEERPSPAQIKALTKLVAFLMQRYNITEQDVLGHKDTKPTDCPGTNLARSIPAIRHAAAVMVADASSALPKTQLEVAANVELLKPTR